MGVTSGNKAFLSTAMMQLLLQLFQQLPVDSERCFQKRDTQLFAKGAACNLA